MRSILIVVAAILLLASCGKKPQAGFTATPNPAEVCQDITFDGSDSYGNSFVWDLGDTCPDGLRNIRYGKTLTHFYCHAGVYDVTLTVSVNGESESVTQQIQIIN